MNASDTVGRQLAKEIRLNSSVVIYVCLNTTATTTTTSNMNRKTSLLMLASRPAKRRKLAELCNVINFMASANVWQA